MWIINRPDGTLFHRHETTGKVESDPVVEKGILHITTGDGTFLGLKLPVAG